MKDYFIIVPSWAIKFKLKGYDLLIYCLIYGFTSVNHGCYLTFKNLGEIVGCSEKQARRCIDRLNSLQYIFYSEEGWIARELRPNVPEKFVKVVDALDKMSHQSDKMSQIVEKKSWDEMLDELDKY